MGGCQSEGGQTIRGDRCAALPTFPSAQSENHPGSAGRPKCPEKTVKAKRRERQVRNTSPKRLVRPLGVIDATHAKRAPATTHPCQLNRARTPVRKGRPAALTGGAKPALWHDNALHRQREGGRVRERWIERGRQARR